jgi:hypothetical protein
MFMQRRGPVQSVESSQKSSSVKMFAAQKQSPSVVTEQRQSTSTVPQAVETPEVKQVVHVSPHLEDPVWANAGVRRLERNGALHAAAAAPAPIRFRAFRREICPAVDSSSTGRSSSMDAPPSQDVVHDVADQRFPHQLAALIPSQPTDERNYATSARVA